MGRRAQLYRDVDTVGDPAIAAILKARPGAASRAQQNQLPAALANIKTPASTKILLALIPDSNVPWVPSHLDKLGVPPMGLRDN